MVAKSISASGTRGSALPVNGRCATPLQRQCRAAASAARYNWRRMARAPTSAPVADRWGDRLPRRLGLWSAVAVLVGSTIGGGIFRTPAIIAERVPAPLAMFGVWTLGGVLADRKSVVEGKSVDLGGRRII